MKRLFLCLIGTLIILGCTQNNLNNQKANNIESDSNFMKVQFKTSDNINIVGNFYDAKSDKNVILLHRFAQNKNSWGNFPSQLQKDGFNVVAIDLRGHGESDLNHESFSDKDFNDMVKDVEAAASFIQNKNKGKVYVIGASIGANTALNYALKNNPEKIVLLSPGLDFKGIKTDASKLQTDALFVVGKNDEYSFRSVKTLYDQDKGKKELKVYNSADHGENMLGQTDLIFYIINWLKT